MKGDGAVYRARDTRLDRTVAIKVVRAEAASSRGPSDRYADRRDFGALHDRGRADAALAAVSGLLAFVLLVVALACWRIRRLEISYSTD